MLSPKMFGMILSLAITLILSSSLYGKDTDVEILEANGENSYIRWKGDDYIETRYYDGYSQTIRVPGRVQEDFQGIEFNGAVRNNLATSNVDVTVKFKFKTLCATSSIFFASTSLENYSFTKKIKNIKPKQTVQFTRFFREKSSCMFTGYNGGLKENTLRTSIVNVSIK